MIENVVRHPATGSPGAIAVPIRSLSRSRWRNKIFSIWFRGLFCFYIADGNVKKPESFWIKVGLVFNDLSKIWRKPELDHIAGARPFLNRFVIKRVESRYEIYREWHFKTDGDVCFVAISYAGLGIGRCIESYRLATNPAVNPKGVFDFTRVLFADRNGLCFQVSEAPLDASRVLKLK